MKTGKVTSAGMYFLCFPVYRLDPAINSASGATIIKLQLLCLFVFCDIYL